MITKLLSQEAITLINHYKNFTVGGGVCSVPYYNNRHLKLRAGLKVLVGKGSPQDIADEIENIAALEKINLKALDSSTLKKLLVDKGLGIDCSGFAYYVLNEESKAKNRGELKKYLYFPNSSNIIQKIRTKIQPIKNAGVAVFADNKNSHRIVVKDVEPGDFITMVGGPDGGERDHILVINQVDYTDSKPSKIHYTHAIAWPADGEYGHGIREGVIDIIDPAKLVTEAIWTEAEKTGEENYTFMRALKSTTDLRRLPILW